MKCRVCGKELKAGAKFCGKCGTKVEIQKTNRLLESSNKCRVCGNELRHGAKFCPKCGTNVEKIKNVSESFKEENSADESNSNSQNKESSVVSIKIPAGENNMANPFFLNGEDPCESILHPKLNPLIKKRRIREVSYKDLEKERLRREAEEEAARQREEEERRRSEEEERLRREAEEACRREEEERRRSEEEERLQREAEDACRREEEERRRREEEERLRREAEEADRIYREEMDRKLAEIKPIEDNIIPDEESIIHNAETELEESSVPGQQQGNVPPVDEHTTAQQFKNGFRTERVEKLAKAKPRKLGK